MEDNGSVVARLMAVIEERKRTMPEKSYTTKLLSGGISTIGNKITEEAAEVIEAAGEMGDGGRQHLVQESCDLIYHLLVLLSHRDVKLPDVEAELARRFGISGLDEKASRGVKAT